MFGWIGRKKRWEQAARTLGMGLSADGSIEGTWGAIPICAYHDYDEDDEGNVSNRRTEFYAPLAPPLMMGLWLCPRGVVTGPLADLFGKGKHEIAVGDRELDDRTRLWALDADHAKRFFPGEVALGVKTILGAMDELMIEDAGVTVVEKGYTEDPAVLKRGLELVGRMARTLLDTRARVRPWWQDVIAQSWGPLAQQTGLAFDPIRCRLEGDVLGVRTTLAVEVGEEDMSTVAHAYVVLPPGVKLSIARQTDGLFAGIFRGQDIEIGHGAFDDAFVVKGEPVSDVRAVLQDDSAPRLLELARECRALDITGGTLTARVSGVLTDARAVKALLERVGATASSLAQ